MPKIGRFDRVIVSKLAGAAGFEPANAGTKSRPEPRLSAKKIAERTIYPQHKINDLEHYRGTLGIAHEWWLLGEDATSPKKKQMLTGPQIRC